jgi:hypothetical protein
MNENSKAISMLLHEMRTTPISTEQFARFAQLVNACTDREIANGTADYVKGLLRVSLNVLEVEKAGVETTIAAMKGELH